MNRSNPRRIRPWARWGAGATAVLAACAVCCAGPLLAVLGSIGLASVVGAIWVPALLMLATAAALALVIVVIRRRRRGSTCSTDTGPVELGMPTIGTDTSDSVPFRSR